MSKYLPEAMPSGMSIEQFCLKNKVPYNLFYKWYKDMRTKIVEVHVDGKPCQTCQAPTSPHEEARPQKENVSVRILLEREEVSCPALDYSAGMTWMV